MGRVNGKRQICGVKLRGKDESCAKKHSIAFGAGDVEQFTNGSKFRH